MLLSCKSFVVFFKKIFHSLSYIKCFIRKTSFVCYAHFGFLNSACLGVPFVAQWKQIQLGTMRLWVRSLAWLNGLRILRSCGCGVGRQHQLRFDP